MSNLSELQIKGVRYSDLRTTWQDLGIVKKFSEVHHLNKNESLYGFIRYCDGKEIKEQNRQTLDRALSLAYFMKNGDSFKNAKMRAWAAYPKIGG